MDRVDPLGLLTLIVALSVYIAAIRLVVIGRLTGDPPVEEPRKSRYKLFLVSLVPGDALLVAAGFFLFLDIFAADLFGGTAPGWFDRVAIWAFFLSGALLVIHHVVAWVRSARHVPLALQ